MKVKKKILAFAVIISFFLHVLFAAFIFFYFDYGSYQPPQEEVIEIDLKQEKQYQIADIMPPKIEKRPKEAKHIGMHDSSVEEETVAVETPRAPGRPVSRGGEGIEKLKKEAEKSPTAMRRREVIKLPKERPGDLGTGRKIPEDFYPDYKRGPHTYINVLKHPDVGYFVRLKRVFKLAWDPTHVLMHRRMTGEVSKGRIRVVLGLAINSSGGISELFVINSSGMGDFDQEAVRAVRASAPFSSPPRKLLASDGILRISWTFVVYM